MTAKRTPARRIRTSQISPPGLAPPSAGILRRALLRWFRSHARALPWRQSASAYPVWVSEVMLQQTQIATVIPYFQRFMEKFPTVRKLAAAPLERVLELWSGLGYYRRARLMHRAAKEIVTRFCGEFPREYEMARSLPGVGDYTARAVLSIAYQKRFFVLDGNVARVIARLTARKGNIHQKPFRRAVEKVLEKWLPRLRPGDFNQAIMQLGQLVCTPAAPRCGACPLRNRCKARLVGAPEDFPSPRPRRKSELQFLAAAVIRQGNRVALVRGLDDGLLNDLWNFPSAFGRSRTIASNSLRHAVRRTFSTSPVSLQPTAKVAHNITHRKILVDIYVGELKKTRPAGARTAASNGTHQSGALRDSSEKGIRWVSSQNLRNVATSRLTRKIAETVSSHMQR